MTVPAAGLDVTALALDRTRAVASGHVAAGRLPSLVFGLVDGAGRSVTWAAGSGGPAERDIDEDSIFFLASVTKGIVATAVMQYVDEGRLDLEAPLARYLPEMHGQGREAISARHILTHTSGLPDIPVDVFRRERPGYDRALGMVLSMRPTWPPGSRYEYNSSAWVLLSEAMARLSRRPFPDVLALRLTRPLGMADTSFDPRAQRSRIVAVRGSRLDNRIAQEVLLRFLARAHLPGGGLFGTLADLLRLGRALLPADDLDRGTRVLSQAAVDEMSRDQFDGMTHQDSDGNVYDVRQALGWRKPPPGWPGSEATFTHGGITGSRLWIDPRAGFALAILSNQWQAPLEPAIEIISEVYRAAA